MYFCPNCNNVFDITKNDSPSQKGGDDGINYKEIMDRLMNDEDIEDNELQNITIDKFTKTDAYKKLQHNEKEIIYNKLTDLIGSPTSPTTTESETLSDAVDELTYFICNNCGFMKKIETGTLIYSKVSTDISQSYTVDDISAMIHSDLLPRTRKYKCPTATCESHKNPSKREASFFRLNNTFRIKYICHACGTNFS